MYAGTEYAAVSAKAKNPSSRNLFLSYAQKNICISHKIILLKQIWISYKFLRSK